MLGWLLGKRKKHQVDHPSATEKHHSGAGNSSLTDTAHGGSLKSALEEASDRALQQRREQRKADRMNRREALFSVVREVMLRSGILSSAYKFKVLSIDQRGRHFLVLLDLSIDLAQTEPAERLVEIEKMIADTALSRMQVVVQAVYWRHFSPSQTASVHLSTGDTQPGGLSSSVRMGDEAAQANHANTKPAESSAADAISTALAELRAKNRARSQERAAEQASQTKGTTDFAATQVAQREQVGGRNTPEQQTFAQTQWQARSAMQADEDELVAFQRALKGEHLMQDDHQASIFVSGRALDTGSGSLEDQHMMDAGIDLSGTQYGELPKF